jgi:hypothetical protein
MPYVPEWERLSDAAAPVMKATGIPKEAAQDDICRAIAERAIEIRIKPERRAVDSFYTSEVHYGEDFQIPAEINREGIDWNRSRPTKTWLVRRGIGLPAGPWHIEWIKVFVPDVTRKLCSAATAESVPRAPDKRSATSRSRPTRERAERALKELYPNGVPPQAVVPNWDLCRKVGEKLRQLGLPDVTDDTIFRAAGRRK